MKILTTSRLRYRRVQFPQTRSTFHPRVQRNAFRHRRAVNIVRSKGGYKLPFPIPETQSAFRRRAQRTAFHRRYVRQQSKLFASRSTAVRQPQLQSALLNLSAIISQSRFIGSLQLASPDEFPKQRNLSAIFSGLNDPLARAQNHTMLFPSP